MADWVNITKILFEKVAFLESRIDELEKFKAKAEVKFAELGKKLS